MLTAVMLGPMIGGVVALMMLDPMNGIAMLLFAIPFIYLFGTIPALAWAVLMIVAIPLYQAGPRVWRLVVGAILGGVTSYSFALWMGSRSSAPPNPDRPSLTIMFLFAGVVSGFVTAFNSSPVDPVKPAPVETLSA